MLHSMARPFRQLAALTVLLPLAVLALLVVPFLQWGMAAWSFVAHRDLPAARRADQLPMRTERALRGLGRWIAGGPAPQR